MLRQRARRDTASNFFPLPNEIFSLGLSPGELAVYSYLLFCEDRKTYQCWPSYRSIGKAVRMSTNTVRKYVAALEESGLIITEPTSIITKGGQKRNGSLLYHIRPIQEAVDRRHEQQLLQLEADVERQRVQAQLSQLCAPQEPLPAEGQPGTPSTS